MKYIWSGTFLVAVVFSLFIGFGWTSPSTVKDGERVWIVDRHGERWDVTQAKSLGFRPEKFQFGIGRYAFTPLDDTDMTRETEHVWGGLRVIGVHEGTDARAYSVPKLSRHEIANSALGKEPIAVGY